MDLSTKLKITAVLAALAMAILWSLPVPSEVADRQLSEVSSAAKTPCLYFRRAPRVLGRKPSLIA
jgi:hypothetical protein